MSSAGDEGALDISLSDLFTIGDLVGSSLFQRAVQTVVASALVSGIYSLRDQMFRLILAAQSSLFGALEDGGAAVASSMATIASVPLSIIASFREAVVPLAGSAGPFAPLVVFGAWILLGILIAILIRLLIWLAPLVIPWL